MTDHSDVPIVATGDWIDAAFINQYWGDNFRAIFQGFANVGSIAYAVDGNTIGELQKPSVDSVLKNTSAGALSWVAMYDVGVPTGGLVPFAGSAAPDGYLLCDGSAVSRSTYARLFSIIGTTWGSGNGSTTFNLPDGRGRAFIGAGQGSGLTNRTLGDSLGTETHALTPAENGAHTHPFTAVLTTGAHDNSSDDGLYYNHPAASSGTTGSSGSGTPHPNMQPSFVGNWIIKI